MKYSVIHLGVFFILIFNIRRSYAQENTLDLSGFKKAQLKYNNEEMDSARLIHRDDKNMVVFSFFEIFDDSVILSINNKNVWKGFIDQKNNPYTSTGWSGIDLQFLTRESGDTATIKLMHQKEYVQFPISNQFPAYMIQRYDNMWYVRTLESTIELK